MSAPPTCFICGGEWAYRFSGADWLYRTTTKSFSIYRCQDCGLERIWPQPSSAELTSFYPKEYYAYNTGKQQTGFLARLRDKVVESAYRSDVRRDLLYYLAKLVRPAFAGLPLARRGAGRFLDVGCGDGTNLRLLERYGWGTAGYEIGPPRRAGNTIYAPRFADVDFGRQQFDYIRIWHVLEHVPDPEPFLQKATALLAPNGIMAIGVPNTKGIYSRLFGRYAYARDIPRHLFNYDVANLRRLLERHGLEVVSVKHQSAGGLLGSIQQFVNARLNRPLDLVNRLPLVLLCYPVDIACNLLGKGDAVAVTARHKTEREDYGR